MISRSIKYKSVLVRLDEAIVHRLNELADRWQISREGAIRRLLIESLSHDEDAPPPVSRIGTRAQHQWAGKGRYASRGAVAAAQSVASPPARGRSDITSSSPSGLAGAIAARAAIWPAKKKARTAKAPKARRGGWGASAKPSRATSTRAAKKISKLAKAPKRNTAKKRGK